MTKAELSSYNRNYMAYKAKNIYYLAFFRKPLLTPPFEAFPSYDWQLMLTIHLVFS